MSKQVRGHHQQRVDFRIRSKVKALDPCPRPRTRSLPRITVRWVERCSKAPSSSWSAYSHPSPMDRCSPSNPNRVFFPSLLLALLSTQKRRSYSQTRQGLRVQHSDRVRVRLCSTPWPVGTTFHAFLPRPDCAHYLQSASINSVLNQLRITCQYSQYTPFRSYRTSPGSAVHISQIVSNSTPLSSHHVCS